MTFRCESKNRGSQLPACFSIKPESGPKIENLGGFDAPDLPWGELADFDFPFDPRAELDETEVDFFLPPGLGLDNLVEQV